MSEIEQLREELRVARNVIANYESIDTLPPPTVEAEPPPSRRESELICALANLSDQTQTWMGRIDLQMAEVQRQLNGLPDVIRSVVTSAMVDVVVELTTRVAKLEKRVDKVELWQRTRASACEGCERLAESGL